MNNDRFFELYNHYLNNTSSLAEERELFQYISQPENAEEVTRLLEATLNSELGDDQLPPYRQQLILNKILDTGSKPVDKKLTKLTWISIAASLMIFLLSGLFFISRKDAPIQLAQDQSHSGIIHPGGNRAVLTLGNGRQINLDDQQNGTITRQGNASVVKLANGQLAYTAGSSSASTMVYNTMRTPRGGKYDLTLADGTRVWLNASSSITYPTIFNGNERNVSITGEAYFEVAHNKNKPFKVKVADQTVEVLGTHFDINAYADEKAVKTTLLEGKVKIAKGIATAILNPGQQSLTQLSEQEIVVQNADTEEATAWKNGFTSFKNADIKTVMRQIARWYNIDVEFEGKISEQRLFTGEISRNAEIDKVFKILELSNVHFRIADTKVIVSP